MTPCTRVPSTKISAVVSDVDGTLVTDDKVLTERARSAVAKLHATGIVFGVMSARPPRGQLMLLGPLQITTPVTGFNGGVLTNPDMTTITEHLLTPEIARRTVDLLERHPAQVWVFSGRDGLLRDADQPYVQLEQRTVGGDMPNDVLMFKKSGFSIAMGNSSDEVKAQARAVTDSNEDEGFANAVRKLVLTSAGFSRRLRG